MRKICIVTGTRAEWGLLSRLAAMIGQDSQMQLQIIATNMHLEERYGLTYKEIEADGFAIDYKVPMAVDGDDECSTVKSMGAAMSGFADAYRALEPDLLVVLGDRYEMLAAVSAALIFRIPVAHLHGGEITQGAYDDAIRHAITKMSHLHFTSTEEARERVIQMGERPDRVYNVGAIGVDNIMQIPLWSKLETEDSLGGFAIDDNTVLVTYHPVTMENNTAQAQIETLLGAFDQIKELRVIFTMPNSDTGSHIIARRIEQWCDNNASRAVWYRSLGLKRYLSSLLYVRAVVGNSSSGIIEAPSFGIYTLNIGDRQKGRIAAQSVIDCLPENDSIIEKLSLILRTERPRHTINPYAKADTAKKILNVLRTVELDSYKQFHTIDNVRS